MKYILIISIFILFFAGVSAQGNKNVVNTKIDKANTVNIGGNGVITDSAKPQLTDSTALISFKDIYDLLQKWGQMDMKGVVFLTIKADIDKLVNDRIKEFQKPKNK